jgi:thiamine kinase-like enzyme
LLSKAELVWLNNQCVGDVIAVEQFTHALTNDVFLMTNDVHKQFVFKRLNRDARSDEDRQAEFLVQKLASEHALTPSVLAHNASYKLQQYICAELLSANSANLFEILARQLQRIHKLPALHAPKQRLVFELKRLKKQLNVPIDEKCFQAMLALADQLDQSSENNTLCHGDLSLNNVLQGKGERYYILDWEYAVIACPAYDLAFCNCINGFSESQCATLINHYHSTLTPPQTESLQSLQKKCDLYLKIFIYINELWSICFVEKA